MVAAKLRVCSRLRVRPRPLPSTFRVRAEASLRAFSMLTTSVLEASPREQSKLRCESTRCLLRVYSKLRCESEVAVRAHSKFQCERIRTFAATILEVSSTLSVKARTRSIMLAVKIVQFIYECMQYRRRRHACMYMHGAPNV